MKNPNTNQVARERNRALAAVAEAKEMFMECDTCCAKTGAPILCDGCFHNRTLINNLLEQRRKAREIFKRVDPDLPDFHQRVKELRRSL